MKWISVKDKLPEINEDVLCAYKINETEYYTIGAIECINTSQYEIGKVTKSIEWRDQNNDIINPEYWARFQTVKEWTK